MADVRVAQPDATSPRAAKPSELKAEWDFSYDIDSDGIEEHALEDGSVGDSEDSAAAEDMRQEMTKALDAFSDEDVGAMEDYLKERGMVAWLQEYVVHRAIAIRQLLLGLGVLLTRATRESADDLSLLPLLKVTLTRILRRRAKLEHYNTVQDVISLLRNSKRVIILTGAGISVSCGIPDFRSSTGLYALLTREGKYELDDPQQMFDINYFKENPKVFYSFASQIYPSNFLPSPCHKFIKLMEDRGILLRNYTQNIDTLESILGVQNVLQCHGSFATASCLQCRRQVPGKEIEPAIFAKEVPKCTACESIPKPVVVKRRKKKNNLKPWESDGSDDMPGEAPVTAIMKPDITFFGEPLTDRFDKSLFEDREKVDLLLVIGTSLKVAPVSEILTHLPHSVPQVLINKTPVPHVNPDVVLLGDADEIVKYLCGELEWSLPDVQVTPRSSLPKRVGQSHVWLFEGAEGGRWIERFKPDAPSKSDQSRSSQGFVSAATIPQQVLNSGLRERDDSDEEARDCKRLRTG